MTKRNLFIALLLAVFLGPMGLWQVQAQKRQLEKADEFFKNLRYIDARDIYLKVAESGYGSEEVFRKLANTYYYNGRYDEAVEWYDKLFEVNPDVLEPLIYLRYSQSLEAVGNHKKAREFFDVFLRKTSENNRYRSSEDYLNLIESNSGRYDMKLIDELYDQKQIAFGATVLEDKLIYSSTEDKPKTFINEVDGWTGKSFLSLYEVQIDTANNVLNQPQKWVHDLKNKYHESSAVFTKDGLTVYFTSSNFTGTMKPKDEPNLKIYRSDFVNSEWQKPVDLSINGETFSTAHPSLSPDEGKLYFASDRPGGFGQTDLYEAEIYIDGTMGHPRNLGPEINTGGRETFPFASEDGYLYFSSDGHFGLGGLDVFAVQLKEGKFKELLNLGKPINSYADDFAYAINNETKYGFFSSDRAVLDTVGIIPSNIYSFKELRPLENLFESIVEGFVTDKDTGKPIKDAEITLRNEKDEVLAQTTTDEQGHYSFEADKTGMYIVRAEKTLYDSEEKITQPDLDQQQIDFELKRNVVIVEPDVDIGLVLNSTMIYFDFDKFNIRKDAEINLQKVRQVMLDYPDMRIKIRSHTDSRGSKDYNRALSRLRAESTRDYLIKHGIKADRLEHEGLGESELVNECTDGVRCSEAQHQQNRRSQFIILK